MPDQRRDASSRNFLPVPPLIAAAGCCDGAVFPLWIFDRAAAPGSRADFEQMTDQTALKSGDRRPSCAWLAKKRRRTPTCQKHVFDLCAAQTAVFSGRFYRETRLDLRIAVTLVEEASVSPEDGKSNAFAAKPLYFICFSPTFWAFFRKADHKSTIAMFRCFLLNDKPRFPTNPVDSQLNQGAFWT